MDQDVVNFQFLKSSSNIIKVIGVGGGGCNAVNHMFEEGIAGVDFIICNTDIQALKNSPVNEKVQLGITLTQGLGAGNKPKMGEDAAIENYEDLKKILRNDTKMLFITAGMGGGTGTGAAPVIAKIARELERENQRILTIAVVTIPSRAEGKKRFEQAMDGIRKLTENVDSLLIVNNERLHSLFGNLPAREAFKLADRIVSTAVKGVAEIITLHGSINIDYADVFTVMSDSKVFIMGTGRAGGEDRAMQAIKSALEFPLLDSNDIKGAKNILLNMISGNTEITIGEIGEIIETLQDLAGQEADIIWGNGYDESLGDEISVTILATDFITNPNRHFQKGKETVRYNLHEKEPVINPEPEPEPEEIVFEKEFTWEPVAEKKPEPKPEPTVRKRQSERQPVQRNRVPSDSSIDNWFYKNFGIGKLFSDSTDEDQEFDDYRRK
jgi:cell division protein FtsZ